MNTGLRELKIGHIYCHFKGDKYKVLHIGEHTETKELFVVYRAMYGDHKIYVRPLTMFIEEVDRIKYPHITIRYRFDHDIEYII